VIAEEEGHHPDLHLTGYNTVVSASVLGFLNRYVSNCESFSPSSRPETMGPEQHVMLQLQGSRRLLLRGKLLRCLRTCLD